MLQYNVPKTSEYKISEEKPSTSQKAGPPDQQLEAELIRCQVGSWSVEYRMGTGLLRVQDPVLFS